MSFFLIVFPENIPKNGKGRNKTESNEQFREMIAKLGPKPFGFIGKTGTPKPYDFHNPFANPFEIRSTIFIRIPKPLDFIWKIASIPRTLINSS